MLAWNVCGIKERLDLQKHANARLPNEEKNHPAVVAGVTGGPRSCEHTGKAVVSVCECDRYTQISGVWWRDAG